MSRIRISLSEWRDEGPSVARQHAHTFGTVGGALVTSAIAVRVVGQTVDIKTPAEIARRARRKGLRPTCGVAMKGWANQHGSRPGPGEPCARMPGHEGSHRSADSMRANAAARRTVSWSLLR